MGRHIVAKKMARKYENLRLNSLGDVLSIGSLSNYDDDDEDNFKKQ